MTQEEMNSKLNQLLNLLTERTKDEESRNLISEIRSCLELASPKISKETPSTTKSLFEQAILVMVGKSTLNY